MARRIRRGRPRLRKTQKIAYRRAVYYDYVAKKEKAVNRLEKKGLPVKDPNILDFDAFETYFKEYKGQLEGRSAKQITSFMVSDEVYYYSEAQFKGVKEAIESNAEMYEEIESAESLLKATREQFRTGKITFSAEDYEAMRETYHRLKQSYLKAGIAPDQAWKMAKEDISQIYWGGSGKS